MLYHDFSRMRKILFRGVVRIFFFLFWESVITTNSQFQIKSSNRPYISYRVLSIKEVVITHSWNTIGKKMQLDNVLTKKDEDINWKTTSLWLPWHLQLIKKTNKKTIHQLVLFFWKVIFLTFWILKDRNYLVVSLTNYKEKPFVFIALTNAFMVI